MFRRLRLPGKLAFAAAPLVIALAAAATLLVQTSFAEAASESRTSALASVLSDLRVAVDAVAEEAVPYVSQTGVGEEVDPSAARGRTDAAIEELRSTLEPLDAPPLGRQLDVAARRLADVRTIVDDGVAASDIMGNRVPAAYDQVSSDLLGIGSLIPAEVASPDSARSLEGLAAIAVARQIAAEQTRIISDELRSTVSLTGTVERIRDLDREFVDAINVFETVASSGARTVFAQSGAPVAIGAADTQIDVLVDAPFEGLSLPQSDWTRLLADRAAALDSFSTTLTDQVRGEAAAASEAATQRAWTVMGVAVAAVAFAAIVTVAISRSVVRRVRTITERAQHVAQDQLPALVEALRDPTEDSLPTMPPIRDRGADEVGDLARSFAAMQSTLEHVAAQQMETLRKGVADMFVTLARRNRSLVDRQLALLDELEASEEDPASLAEFYKLDHMATRMRRNAESLLVLAGTEPARAWRTPLSIDDVVRAAIGEIEEYRRVDVLTLESVRLQGTVVADLSHLLSELLENATHFSPPETRVRVSGHFHEQGYLISVTDRGLGIPEARLTELNRLLDRPPVVGLAIEPTLGLFVVAMLAKRHGIQVRLVPGAPGISAKLLVPPSLYAEASPSDGRDDGVLVGVAAGAPSPSTDVAGRPGRHPSDPGDPRPRGGQVQHRGDPGDARGAAPPAPSDRPNAPTDSGTAPERAETTGGLPTRRPGATYEPEPGQERSVGGSARTPDSVRSRFGAFQTGLEAGRRAAADEEDRR